MDQSQNLTVNVETETPPYLRPGSDYTSESDEDPNVDETELRPRREASKRARVVIANACRGRPMGETITIPLRRVKLKVEDSDVPVITRVQSSVAEARKRRREVIDCVLIPTSRLFKRVKLENGGESVVLRAATVTSEHADTEKNFKKILKLWENSKVKKKKNNPLLLEETIRSRIRHIGFDVQDQYFTIDRFTREVMVTRAFMSNVYGGSAQSAFPKPSAKKIREHGLNDFMFLNTNFQPQAPEVLGAPGLWFNPNENGNKGVRRVFTKINMGKINNQWLYVGQYDVRLANPPLLSMQEWRAQPAALQNCWAKAIANQGWGDWACARITARKLLGREPTDNECEKLVKSGRYRGVTADEVNAAYHSGKELMAVWTMKCVGYDNKFQKEISKKYPTWVYTPLKTKVKKEEEEVKEEEEEEALEYESEEEQD